MIYSLDTSAFMDGLDRYYPTDVFPAVWKRFDELASKMRIKVSEEVLRELKGLSPKVHYPWLNARSSIHVSNDTQLMQIVTDIQTKHPTLVDIRNHKSIADPFVIGVAKQYGCAVVSAELPARSYETRVKIPDVCKKMGIQHMTLLEVFRREGWKF